MTIIMLDCQNFDTWRHQIEELINISAKLNFEDYNLEEDYGSRRCDALEEYLKEEKAAAFVCAEENRLLGWIWCHEINRLSKRRLHIAEIAVSEDYRTKGVGSQLLKHVEQYAAENDYSEIDLLVTKSNQAAVRFYEKAAYEVERYLMKKELKL